MFISNLITVKRLTNIQLDSVSLTDGERTNGTVGSADESGLKRHQGAVVLLHLDGQLSLGVGCGLRQR